MSSGPTSETNLQVDGPCPVRAPFGGDWRLAVVLLTAVLVMLPGLGRTRFWDEDEGFYATAAAEMYARGDLVVPTFNQDLFGHKPPFMYWMMMGGFSLFGVGEFGARIGSALFGVATAGLTYRLGRRLFSPTTGLFAGLVMASCLMFSVVARSATSDSYLTFFALLALYLWARAALPAGADQAAPGSARGEVRWRTWAAAYVAMGLGALTKGPIGFLFPMAVIGLVMLCRTPRPRSWLDGFGPVNFFGTIWRMRPLTGMVVILTVAGPWYYQVGVATNGEFLREFIGVHHLGRATRAMESHSGPFYYYVVSCLLGMIPWSILAVPAGLVWWQRLRSADRERPAITFVTCWALVYLVIFSLARTKLSNYVLPAYPALALIVGRCVDAWLTSPGVIGSRWMNGTWILLLLQSLVFLIGLPVVCWWDFNGQTLADRMRLNPTLLPAAGWLGLLALPTAIGAVVVLKLGERQRGAASAVIAVAALAILVGLWNFGAPLIDQFQTPQTIAQKLCRDNADRPIRVGCFCQFRPTMVFYLGQRLENFATPAAAGEFLCQQEVPSYLVTIEAQYSELKPWLPADVEVVDRTHRFPRKGELLVLARRGTIVDRQHAMAPR